eukprot:TRINITY_DN18550_c0_g2_i1.p1 TRINITY_DN18550_c0_g2~~TRINITY_DN18550_c0_g2_i1.p1  ORF type:complete len:129 (-),score=10.54 TRINITY_DN18550_c0_g2_i1:310-696(-)
MSTFANVFDWIGFCGAAIFPIATTIQLWKIVTTQSANDISYVWQGNYIFGAICSLIYCVYYHLWALVIPWGLDLIIICAMTVVKVQLERAAPSEDTGMFIGATVEQTASESALPSSRQGPLNSRDEMV